MPYLLLVLSTLFWSGNFVISRGMHSSITPIGLSFWRWSIAMIILFFIVSKNIKKDFNVIKKNFKFLFIQALFGVTGFNTLIYIAMHHTTAINAVLVNSSIPVIIAIMSWFMYKEKLKIMQIIGISVSFVGVIYLMTGGNIYSIVKLNFNKGDLLVLCAAFTWAFYSANLKKYPKELNMITYLFFITVIGLILILPMYVLEILSGNTFKINTANILTILYVGAFASVAAFIFWNKAVRETGANKAGPFVHLMPVFSITMAIIFLGENFEYFQLSGMILIFIGIFLTTFKFKNIL
jgi:drug/metabolite transporter (DMT)-like permease